MNRKITRRSFLVGGSAATIFTGCANARPFFMAPDLVFGVISDPHVTTPKSCRLLEKTFRMFRSKGVDAVVVAGDLSDWGLRSSLALFGETWNRVFGGTSVVPLFCTGNHDYDGWWYGDMAMEMHANGYSEGDAVTKNGGMKACWESAFREPFAAIRRRTVKGYDFISGEWEGCEDLSAWLLTNGASLRADRPFFYFQHRPIAGTTPDSLDPDSDAARNQKEMLSGFPNCVAFTGHTHRPFIDERSVWQDGFTVIAVPSLSYAVLPLGYENGDDRRNGQSRLAMPRVQTRRDLRGGQGYLVKVYGEQVVVERWDMEENDSDAHDWIIPFAVKGHERPYASDVRVRSEPVPQFPRDAGLDLETRNSEDRSGKWVIVLNCEFPSAEMPSGSRVFDYEIRVVDMDGTIALSKLFLSPAFAKMSRFEPRRQRFWFNVAEMPQDRDCWVEVRARNAFGRPSEPLCSEILHIAPGLGKSRK